MHMHHTLDWSLCPREWWQSIVISSICQSVCVPCICLSVQQDISRTTCAIFTKFFLHVAYGCGSVLLQRGDENPRGRGNFGVFPPYWQCIVMRSLQIMSCSSRTDHSIAATFAANGISREQGDWSAHRGRSVVWDWLVIVWNLTEVPLIGNYMFW